MNDERARRVAVRLMHQVHEGMLASFIARGGRGVEEAEFLDELGAAIEQLRAPRVEAGGGDAGWPVSVGSISITRGEDRVEIAWNDKPILGVTAEGAVGTWDAEGEWRELFNANETTARMES
jgi:hypothetical protein